MATLRSERDGRRFEAAAHTVIGRGPGCTLRLDAGFVSSEHASLVWRGRWELHDLGSTNGTFVDGRRLDAGARQELEVGARVAFGDTIEVWQVVELNPPSARAVSEAGEERRGAGGLLPLPDEEAPQVQVYARSDGSWIADDGASERQVEDGSVLRVEGREWTLHLPTAIPRTGAPGRRSTSLEEIGLTFRVSADEEHVEVEIALPDRIERLDHRAYNYMLLTLARARLEEADVPESERGWLYQDDLVRMLDLLPTNLYLLVFRARQQLAAMGVDDAATLIERRRGSGQLRIGVRRLEVVRPDR